MEAITVVAIGFAVLLLLAWWRKSVEAVTERVRVENLGEALASVAELLQRPDNGERIGPTMRRRAVANCLHALKGAGLLPETRQDCAGSTIDTESACVCGDGCECGEVTP